MNSFDFDGVISIGVYPGPGDIIITGRSIEEEKETYAFLRSRRIFNRVYFNSIPFANKTRESSARHKVDTLQVLADAGVSINIHFEDDPIQADIIESSGLVNVVRLWHDLTNKENVRYDENCNPV
jgi:hypothetical protein